MPIVKKKKTRRKRRGHYHRGVHSSPKAGDCSYRSGWELVYMIWLDENPSVLKYSYEGLIIEYVSNIRTGKLRKYYPDFMVDYEGRQELIEIKPAKRVTQVKVAKKLKAAEAWCKTHGVVFKVITEKELKVLGILK